MLILKIELNQNFNLSKPNDEEKILDKKEEENTNIFKNFDKISRFTSPKCSSELKNEPSQHIYNTKKVERNYNYNKNLMLSPNDKENHEVPNNEEKTQIDANITYMKKKIKVVSVLQNTVSKIKTSVQNNDPKEITYNNNSQSTNNFKTRFVSLSDRKKNQTEFLRPKEFVSI